jgi:hypothetical protein
MKKAAASIFGMPKETSISVRLELTLVLWLLTEDLQFSAGLRSFHVMKNHFSSRYKEIPYKRKNLDVV